MRNLLSVQHEAVDAIRVVCYHARRPDVLSEHPNVEIELTWAFCVYARDFKQTRLYRESTKQVILHLKELAPLHNKQLTATSHESDVRNTQCL